MMTAVASVSSQPALEIPNNRFDFGIVSQNSTLVHYYWFKSVGTDTLEITRIKTGCSCALMPMETDKIAPGDSIRVGIYWDVKRNNGSIGRYPYIYTNAGPDPYRVFLTAKVIMDLLSVRPVAVRPYKLEVPKLQQKSIDSLEFILHNFNSYDLTCEIISLPFDECEIFVPKILKAESDNIGYIKVNKDYLYQEFKRSISIRLSDPKADIITIPIRRKFY